MAETVVFLRITGTMETLASQAEIGVWVQKSRRSGGRSFPLQGSQGITAGVYANSWNIVHFWPENGSQCRP